VKLKILLGTPCFSGHCFGLGLDFNSEAIVFFYLATVFGFDISVIHVQLFAWLGEAWPCI
jgi:hypothetical protein